MEGLEGRELSSILRDELVQSDQGFVQGPIRALMAALLFDGVQGYLNHKDESRPKLHARCKEAIEWISNRSSSDYLFSFEFICEALGFDPEAIREGLTQQADARDNRRKIRRNF